MGRACRAAPLLLAVAAPLFLLLDNNGRAPFFCAASGTPPIKYGASTLLEGDPASADPEQVHIALAESGSLEQYAMTVAWVTWPEARSQVAWGSSPEELGNMAEGNATSERKKDAMTGGSSCLHTYLYYSQFTVLLL